MTLGRVAFYEAAAGIVGSESSEFLDFIWGKLEREVYVFDDNSSIRAAVGEKFFIFLSFLKILTAKPEELPEVTTDQGLNLDLVEAALGGERLDIDPSALTAPLYEALTTYGSHRC